MSMAPIERAATTFDSYKDRYTNIQFSRDDGILEMRFHTEGGPLQWSLVAHNEFESAFLEVGRDRGNEVVIMTGTGAEFCGPAVEPGKHPNRNTMTPETYDPIFWESKQLLPHLLSIEAPIIAAINGPASRHGEIPLLSDIVLASDDTYFQDTAHFSGGMVPGDGMHIVMPLLMGFNRGRYFLFTGQKLAAEGSQDDWPGQRSAASRQAARPGARTGAADPAAAEAGPALHADCADRGVARAYARLARLWPGA